MPRPVTELGSYGDIGAKEQKNGKWRAWATFRDYDGKGRLVEAYGPTQSKAKTELRKKLTARQKQYKGRARQDQPGYASRAPDGYVARRGETR